ncbi:MAG: PAS domain S-box protein [Chitinophagaceae bacterium]|nr:PAS domain S-box protein [Chitinophagaceae bacterium]MBP9739075.1 PAS domain S-box protein [Chitinophagaceae bacterium]
MLFSELDKELLLSKITSSTSLKVYVFDMDEEQVVYTNNSIVESLGYTREQVKTFGKNVLQEILHPEDLANAEDRMQRLSSLKDDEEYILVQRYKKSTGEYGWFKNTRSVFKRNALGEVQQVIGIMHEVTEEVDNLKKLHDTQDRFKAIFNSTSDFNFFVDKDFNIITLNQAAILYTEKYAGMKLFPGINLKMAMHDSMHADADIALQQSLQGEIVDITKEYLSATGENIWFRAKFFPVYDEQFKTITGVNVNMRDVTKSVQAKVELEHQNIQLKEIARINSHEIRRPLANILGLIEMLGHYQDDLSSDLKDLIQLLHQSSSELDAVVKKIVVTASKK